MTVRHRQLGAAFNDQNREPKRRLISLKMRTPPRGRPPVYFRPHHFQYLRDSLLIEKMDRQHQCATDLPDRRVRLAPEIVEKSKQLRQISHCWQFSQGLYIRFRMSITLKRPHRVDSESEHSAVQLPSKVELPDVRIDCPKTFLHQLLPSRGRRSCLFQDPLERTNLESFLNVSRSRSPSHTMTRDANRLDTIPWQA